MVVKLHDVIDMLNFEIDENYVGYTFDSIKKNELVVIFQENEEGELVESKYKITVELIED